MNGKMTLKEREEAIGEALDYVLAYVESNEGIERDIDFYIPGIRALTGEEIRDYGERLKEFRKYQKNHPEAAA